MPFEPPSTLDAETRARLYQATEAHEEVLTLLKERNAAVQSLAEFRRMPASPVRSPSFLGRHARQLYWTLTRAIGLAHLHDGSRTRSVASSADTLADPVQQPLHLLPVPSAAPQRRPRILVDVTGTAFHDFVGGIQRFVREIAAAAYTSGEALPVIVADGALWTIYDGVAQKRRVVFEDGDVLFVPDIHHQYIATYRNLIGPLRAADGRFVVFMHDVIPMTHPTTCYPGLPDAFLRWFTFVAAEADAIVAPSAVAADSVRWAIHSLDIRRALPIGWVHLASSLRLNGKPHCAAVARALSSSRCFVMVGTLEPRKGHALALDAFDRLWASDHDVSLLIFARAGWCTQHVASRIEDHPRYGVSLFRLKDAEDDDLAHAYAGCAGLVAPSLVEGYGLPLVEAASFGAHRIVSDIPVFREVAGDANVTFVPLCDPAALAAAIAAVPARAHQTRCDVTPRATWADVASDLFAMIRTEGYQDRGVDAPQVEPV